MQIFGAAILGILQGLTEFLPISSSAHLILVPWFLGWEPEGIVFDVSLHVGTAVAVLAYFRADWIRLLREVIAGFRQGNLWANPSQKLFWFLAVGTLPAMFVGLALEKTVETQLRSPLIAVFTLVIFGALLLWAERKSRQNRTIEQFTWADCIWIGLCQAIALIPGVSRSGVTITAALFRDSDRHSAARFSFLLSTPVIVGAGLLSGLRAVEAARYPAAQAAVMNWEMLAMATGTLCAAITGFLCIRYFLRYLQTKSFMPFIIYRWVLAAVVLIYYIKYQI